MLAASNPQIPPVVFNPTIESLDPQMMAALKQITSASKQIMHPEVSSSTVHHQHRKR